MKFKLRTVVVILTLLLCWLGLKDTIEWYFVMPESEKDLIGLSLEEVDALSTNQKAKVLALKEKRKRVLNLGLDLQGGLYLVLSVDEKSLTEDLVARYTVDLKTSTNGTFRTMSVTNPEFIREVTRRVDENFAREKDSATASAYEKIKNRVDQFGVSEPLVEKGNDQRIYVSLAGIKDPQAAEEIVSKAGRLTFQIVDEDLMKSFIDKYAQTRPELFSLVEHRSRSGKSVEYLINVDGILPADFEVPEGTAVYWIWERDRFGTSKKKGGIFLKKEIVLDGKYIDSAQPSFGQYSSEVHVSFTLKDTKLDEDKETGVEQLARVTGENVNKRMAIVLDGKVQSYPVIKGRIPGGSGQITGNFTAEEAKNLSAILNAGSFKASLKVDEKRSVGPSLGRDSIMAGVQAAMIGFVLIVVFMAVYYKYAGFLSDIALLLNFVIALAVMTQLQATLTLPGIGGLILMLGMAVDANVLIFERIREEMRRGDATMRVAIDKGFGRAFMTIFDSNLTTLLSALVMMQMGSGMVKGFAVTLFIGILTSMFTALFVTRYLVDGSMSLFKIKRLPI